MKHHAHSSTFILMCNFCSYIQAGSLVFIQPTSEILAANTLRESIVTSIPRRKRFTLRELNFLDKESKYFFLSLRKNPMELRNSAKGVLEHVRLVWEPTYNKSQIKYG